MKTTRKKTKKRSWKKIAFVAVCVLIAITGLAIIFVKLHDYGEKVQRAKNATETIRRVTDGHHFSKSGIVDSWWVNEQFEKNIDTYDMLERRATRMQELIQKHKDVSTETKAIAERFQEILTAFWINNEPRVLRSRRSITNEIHTNYMVICFIAKQDALRQNLLTPFWSTSLGFITLPTVELPETLLIAVLYHELGHAKRHNKIDGELAESFESAAHTAEEVEMHELEGKVLNAVSGGKYHELLDKIASRYKSAKTFEQAMAMITREDCLVLDRMFECTETDLPSNILITHAVMEIGFRYCDAHGLGMQEKIEVYRWFDRYIFTPISKPEMRR